ncbi:uncharacterized protein LOC116776991 [Danaus plexippus]|uniref:uncharacterized protein LOC116776991 n=1 Tax=Danaus plexippus TaxID=13037 RepID=UPI002AB3195B|nr:uncharacterized protein LOC116776991 [Danaus plexippus]
MKKKNYYAKTYKIIMNKKEDDRSGDLMYLPSTSRGWRREDTEESMKDSAMKKTQFKTEKSLLTFHEHKDSERPRADSKENDGKETGRDGGADDDIREIYSDGIVSNTSLADKMKPTKEKIPIEVYEDLGNRIRDSEQLVLAKLDEVIRLLEKKDAT